MNRRQFLKNLGVGAAAMTFSGYTALAQKASAGALDGKMPNIVVILADDMGYGELQYLNPKRGKIKTPQLDSPSTGIKTKRQLAGKEREHDDRLYRLSFQELRRGSLLSV